ncbi:sugar transporter [Datura stramonium]|uniref:Sugar transporter n=1 Tax=Datura stramonium TaxID=4076 RepID=A0ABS8V1T2_DATST|nr:sugar transporter [Datura stramonium]
MDAVSIKVPYKNLKQEVELTNVDESRFTHLEIRSDSSSSPRASNGEMSDSQPHRPPIRNSLLTLILAATVAAGVQFGWAWQPLLTPYIQTLGIEHAFFFYLAFVVLLLALWYNLVRERVSADIGYLLGDTKEHCSTFKGTRSRAAIVFVVGFWMLDLANNTVQGPARALLADLSGPDQRNTANAVFCSWMAVGNILGFSAGASGGWHRWFPFLTNRACCEPCGNLKAAFLVAVVFLTLCTLVTLYFAKEVPLPPKQTNHLSDSAPLLDSPQNTGFDLSQSKRESQSVNNVANNESGMAHVADNSPKNEEQRPEQDQGDNFTDSPGAVLVNLLTSLRHLPPAMHSVLIVMALTWLSWFPFFLFDTDWMGREVYHGDPKGEAAEVNAYNQGVREGAFGLLLNSVVLGITSFLIEPMCKWIGSRLVWAVSNLIVFACMACTAIISVVSISEHSQGVQHVIGATRSTQIAALVVFSLLGIPLAVTYSVPFSITAELTADAGGGQGLAIGVLNLAIVIPQMVVSLGAGPWDALFGGGNIPAFVLASVSALGAGIFAMVRLPNLSSNSYKSTGLHFG